MLQALGRAAVVFAAAALALAGCGGGSSGTATTAPQAPQSAPAATSTTPAQQPTATTGVPPKHHRKKPQPLENGGSSTAPLRVTTRYTCNGKPLRAIAADGPVTVQPAIVKAGQTFAVVVTDPSAKVALVSLAGVAPKPIQANATQQGGRLAATLKMPAYATCGNKLLEVEGDVSAEAYVGVSR